MKNFRFIALLLFGSLITIFWENPVLFPFKTLVVLVHEIWHGITAMIFNGTIEKIMIGSGESGTTVIYNLNTASGFIFGVSAGYLGSTLTGSIMLNRGLNGSLERFFLLIFILTLSYMTLLFTEAKSIAFYTGIGWSVAGLTALLFGKMASRYFLIGMGTLFIWYSMFDTFDFKRNIEKTDAGHLAAFLQQKEILPSFIELNTAAYFISAFWILLMIGTVYVFLAGLRHHTPVPTQPPPVSFKQEEFTNPSK